MRGESARSIIPVVMAGVLGIYGLITAVIINGKLDPPDTYSQSDRIDFALCWRLDHEERVNFKESMPAGTAIFSGCVLKIH